MPKFLIRGSYTAESMKAMMGNPGDRSKVASSLAEGVGGRMEAFYWAFGEDDWVAIADLPDDASAGAISDALSASGSMKAVRTTRLITMDEVHQMLEKARGEADRYVMPGR